MDSQPVAASTIHPDVLHLAQQIVDETRLMVEKVETLDANQWFPHADKIEQLNTQLQGLLLPASVA